MIFNKLPYRISLNKAKKMNNNYVIMNLIIILAKKHIYRQRLEKKKPRLDIFLTELRYYFEVEKAIYHNQRKYSDFRSRWKVIISWFEWYGASIIFTTLPFQHVPSWNNNRPCECVSESCLVSFLCHPCCTFIIVICLCTICHHMYIFFLQ